MITDLTTNMTQLKQTVALLMNRLDNNQIVMEQTLNYFHQFAQDAYMGRANIGNLVINLKRLPQVKPIKNPLSSYLKANLHDEKLTQILTDINLYVDSFNTFLDMIPSVTFDDTLESIMDLYQFFVLNIIVNRDYAKKSYETFIDLY